MLHKTLQRLTVRINNSMQSRRKAAIQRPTFRPLLLQTSMFIFLINDTAEINNAENFVSFI
jgi:hypothetical protein